MDISLTPTEVLTFSLLEAEHFGLHNDLTEDEHEEVYYPLDDPENPNIVQHELMFAQNVLTDVAPAPAGVDGDPLTTEQVRWRNAWAWLTTAYLYRHLAGARALEAGLVTGPGGQTNIPLGSASELNRIANHYAERAAQLYPELPAFDTERSAGSVQVRRVY